LKLVQKHACRSWLLMSAISCNRRYWPDHIIIGSYKRSPQSLYACELGRNVKNWYLVMLDRDR